MPTNQVAENVLGTIVLFRFLWALSAPFFGVYAIIRNLNVPLIVQPQILSLLCLTSWAQCQYYGHLQKVTTTMVVYVIILAVLAGFEIGMVFAVRPSYRDGNSRPIQFFGIFSSVLLSIALLPQYYEIYKHREVIGISILFMLVDLMGGVFSILSLVFKAEFDVIAAVTYSLVVFLDGIVILLALILNPLAKRRRKREAQADAVMAEHSTAPTPFLDQNEANLRHSDNNPQLKIQ
ncbi:unnamed protein product [Somion occarium]|uniref:Uncharacterized protein n=1 Tax=Somion occarium TaxID=3059160 RepID=A0ABP1DDG7_9APHY